MVTVTSFSEVVAIVGFGSTAFMAGLLWVFASSVMPGLDPIDPAESLKAMKVINRDIVTPIFVALFLASFVAAMAAVVVAITSLPEDGWLLAAGVLHLVGFMAVTVIIHLPLNARIETLDDSPDALAEWKQGASRWSRFNRLRATAAILSAVAYALHIALS